MPFLSDADKARFSKDIRFRARIERSFRAGPQHWPVGEPDTVILELESLDPEGQQVSLSIPLTKEESMKVLLNDVMEVTVQITTTDPWLHKALDR